MPLFIRVAVFLQKTSQARHTLSGIFLQLYCMAPLDAVKTSLAQAISNAANATFYSVESVMDKFVGESEKSVLIFWFSIR